MIIDNETINLKDELRKWINKSDEVFICSPFISFNDVLFELIESKKKLTLVCRLSYPASPKLFEKLYDSLSKNQFIYVYDDNSLHSKIYLFKKDGKFLNAIVGSSNFTDSGIFSNKEYNIQVTKELDRIGNYFKLLTNDALGKLSKEIIDYYKTFYTLPIKNERYRKAIISNKLSEEYADVLNKYYRVKGILENENNSDLPFTYVFDSFCHFFKVAIRNDYAVKEETSFNKQSLLNYFKIFLSKYIDRDLDWRRERYILSKKIAENIDSVKGQEIKDFFLGIHSIATGSGSGERKRNIREIDATPLRDLLKFLLTSNLSMPHKYSIALTDKNNNGLKIPQIGPSAIGEIPGWLIPDMYPVINGKLYDLFDFFKV